MISLFRKCILLWLITVSMVTAAQQTAPSKLPACAQLCLKSAFATNTCAPTDQACICTNEVFQNNVTLCVSSSCTIPEALVTRNVSLTNCGAPVRHRGEHYVTLSNAMAAIAAVFVAIRFIFKATVSRLDIGYDDWCVLATLIAAIPSAIITVFGTVKNGLGQDLWALTPSQITQMLQYFYIMAWLYFLQLTLLKLTLLFFYIRVFPSKDVQRLLWGTVIFTVMWGVAFIIVAIFQCRPIHYFWTKWDGLHEGTCLEINAITASNAAISIALDFWILGVPLWQLWGLKLHWKKKVGVALMFCVGTFVTVVSILRLQALVHFAASSNVSWEFYDVSVWSTIEICVGIMCACLPTLRLLLVKLFPILGGSSVRSRQQYYNYGSGNELKNVSQKHKSYNVNTQLEKRLGELDKRQEKELIRVVDKVPELLNHINGFLTDGDFIKKAAELALRDSKDFLSYYKKIEMLFTSYWGTVVQGIVLLNMAHLSKRVHFEESPQTIKKHGEKLLKQVNDFYEVLGHELCLIAQSVLAAANSPGAQVPVYFSSGWGKGIGIEIHWKQVKKNWWDNLISWAAKTDSLAPSQWGYQALKVVKSDDHYKYFLEPITDIAPGKDFNIAKAYPMRLCGGNLAIKNRLNRFSGVEGVDAIQDPAGPNAISMDTDSNFDWREESSDWHIRPVSVGGNNFYFEAAGYRGGEPDHSVLVTSTRDDELEWRDNLDPSEGFAASLNRAYFQLRPAS